MTDDQSNPSNLTPAKPIAPRRRIPANPRMAQPMRPPEPERVWEPDPELETSVERVPEAMAEQPAEPQPAPAAMQPAPEPIAVLPEPPALVLPEPPAAVLPAPPTPLPPEPPPATSVAESPPAVEAAAPEADFPKTVRDTLRHVDQAWLTFRAAAMRFPSERMDEHLTEDGWTRKQMLAHVAAWHDLTADRIVKLINTGNSVPLDRDTDAFNAAVARQAIGKTAGEVLQDMDKTFNRLRRQMQRLTDAQLRIDDWWAAWVIGGNTYGHYQEHWADIYSPEPVPGNGGRR